MRCIVTGGGGFIGSNLVRALIRRNWEVVVVDDFSTGCEELVDGLSAEIVRADITDGFEPEGDFDVVFHQAAITDPRYEDDERTYDINVNGHKNVLDYAVKTNTKLIYASTANMYGNAAPPQKETSTKELFSEYARSKIIGDEIASHYWSDHHIVGLRYFNVFGPGEAFKGRSASMIYHLYNQIVSGKQPRLFKWGEQIRDHVYVADCVRANLLALNGKSGIYNVGTGTGTKFSELVDMLGEHLGVRPEIDYFDNPYGDLYQENTVACLERASQGIGYKPKFSTSEGIAQYVEHLRQETPPYDIAAAAIDDT